MHKFLAILALVAVVGCKTPTLETGGAYAPTATTAVTASPKSAWGSPITADSTTPGRASISASTSLG